MTVLTQKAGDTSLLKADAIIAIYDRLIKDLELEDLQTIGLSPSREGSKFSANAPRQLPLQIHGLAC